MRAVDDTLLARNWLPSRINRETSWQLRESRMYPVWDEVRFRVSHTMLDVLIPCLNDLTDPRRSG